MAKMGEQIMYKIGILGKDSGLHLERESCIGRMLYYKKSNNNENPFWCGSHFDHGLFTVILPAVYFVNGEQVPEPKEAGLFVKSTKEKSFKKVAANNLDIMMFQVGEFGQLVKNDSIYATEHRVHKAEGPVERYTLAVFYNAPMDIPIHSTSVLTNDARYGEKTGNSCTYRHWNEASLQRYAVQEN